MPKIAAVVVNLIVKTGIDTFHYLVPDFLIKQVKIGCRVQVPVGRQICEGYVVDFPETPEIKELKEIKELIDQEPVISQEMVKVARWVSEKYLCPLYKVLEYIIPPYARLKKEKWVKLTSQSNKLLVTIALLDDLVNNILAQLKKGAQNYY